MSNEHFYAYGPDHRGTETVMRMHSVKRWHMIDTTRIQTLAEHSANVALLAMYIAKTAPIEFFDTYTAVAAAALAHDIPEVFTGDIPSYTKHSLIGLGGLERSLTPVEFTTVVNTSTQALIKLCDLADGIRFIRLHGVDMTAAHAQRGLEAQLERKKAEVIVELNWPEHLVNYVMAQIWFYAYETPQAT